MADLHRSDVTGRRRALQLSATALTTGLAGCVASLRTVSGEPRPTVEWEQAIPGVQSLVTGPRLVYADTERRVLGLDRAQGDTAWTRQVAADAAVTPGPGTLFLDAGAPDRADLQVLDAGTGEPRWRVERLAVYPPTVVTGDTAYVTGGSSGSDRDDGLQARDLATGAVDWTFRAAGVELPVAVADGTLTVTTMYGDDAGSAPHPTGVYALDASDGTVEWHADRPTPWGPAVLGSDALFVGTDTVARGPPRVVAFDAADGRRRWEYAGADERGSDSAWPVRVAGERVVVRAEGRTLTLDARTGERVWRVRGVPVGMRDGRLYLARGRTLIAADAADGPETWSFTVPRSATAGDGASFGIYDEVAVAVSGSTAFGLDPVTGDERWRFAADGPLVDVRIDGADGFAATRDRVSALALS